MSEMCHSPSSSAPLARRPAGQLSLESEGPKIRTKLRQIACRPGRLHRKRMPSIHSLLVIQALARLRSLDSAPARAAPKLEPAGALIEGRDRLWVQTRSGGKMCSSLESQSQRYAHIPYLHVHM